METLIQEILTFRDNRDWKQFHTPKNLASAISIEAAELSEIFLWKTDEDSYNVDKERVSEEIADVIIYAILLSETFGFDLIDIISKKINKNKIKYPLHKSKGNARKYNEL